MNCSQMFLTYAGFEELIKVFKSKKQEDQAQIDFSQFLAILSVKTNGRFEHRINCFLDMHDV